MYGYYEMVEKDKKEFDEWYNTNQDLHFDFKQEMYKYCRSDVDILRRGCLVFRQLFIDIAPFQYITIAVYHNCRGLYGYL